MGYPPASSASHERPQPYRAIRIVLLIILGFKLVLLPIGALGTVAILKQNTAETAQSVNIQFAIVFAMMAFEFLVALLGFLGAYRENYGMTKAFAIVMLIIVILRVIRIATLTAVGLVNFAFSLILPFMAFYVARESLKYTGGATVVYA
ncbi:hypothetical protein HDE_07742 [Halotydeus destructor]|nr:hypothetical protein HDE_07742 [Halotydeus destructor]